MYSKLTPPSVQRGSSVTLHPSPSLKEAGPPMHSNPTFVPTVDQMKAAMTLAPIASKMAKTLSHEQVSLQLDGTKASSKPLPPLSNNPDELRKREEDLRRREAALAQRIGASSDSVKKNWPRCCPLLVHDISNEIPTTLRKPTYMLYLAFLAFFFLQLWQWLSVTASFIVYGKNTTSAWFLCTIYLLVGIPAGFYGWYYRYYKSARGGDGTGGVVFKALLTLHLAYCVYCAIAPPIKLTSVINGGAVTGWLSAIDAFKVKKWLGVFYLIGAVGWTVEAIFVLYVGRIIYKVNRG